MAQFIHLAEERHRRSIRQCGIKVSRSTPLVGVYAYPQTENFVVNHQWMRELKRIRGKPMIAVRLRIPDSERVLIGKFNVEHIEISASEAVGMARNHEDPLGLEVVIPRSVRAREVQSFYVPPKAVGWRYYPAAKGRKPCGCAYCQRGEPYSKRIRRAYDAEDAQS